MKQVAPWLLALVVPFLVAGTVAYLTLYSTFGVCELLWGPCGGCGRLIEKVCEPYSWFLHLNSILVGIFCGAAFPLCFYFLAPGENGRFVALYVALSLVFIEVLFGLISRSREVALLFLGEGPALTLVCAGSGTLLISCWILTRRQSRGLCSHPPMDKED